MKNKILTVCILVWSFQLNAAVFCVDTYAEIRAALILAENNNQHNVIKVVEGNYLSTGSAHTLKYNGSGGWDLNVSGGWTEFVGNPCGQQLSGTPYNTILDGNNNTQIMSISAGGNAKITISNFAFINGGSINLEHGGGIYLLFTGSQLLIERNVFINNRARYSSAMYLITGGGKSVIRNNIFTLNSTTNGSDTSLISAATDSNIYFTNNTMVQNTGDNIDNYGGLHLSTHTGSQIYIGNNVLFDNGSRDFDIHGPGAVYLHHNNVGIRTGEEPFSMTANISSAPEFNTGILEFTPSYGSPLINAGFDPPNAVPNPTPFELAWFEGTVDLVGNIRKQMGKVDIGAIETSAEPPIFINGFE